jgi:hypothetical protein
MSMLVKLKFILIKNDKNYIMKKGKNMILIILKMKKLRIIIKNKFQILILVETIAAYWVNIIEKVQIFLKEIIQ